MDDEMGKTEPFEHGVHRVKKDVGIIRRAVAKKRTKNQRFNSDIQSRSRATIRDDPTALPVVRASAVSARNNLHAIRCNLIAKYAI